MAFSFLKIKTITIYIVNYFKFLRQKIIKAYSQSYEINISVKNKVKLYVFACVLYKHSKPNHVHYMFVPQNANSNI